MIVNIAALAPMPSASVATAAAAKPRFRVMNQSAWRKSFNICGNYDRFLQVPDPAFIIQSSPFVPGRRRLSQRAGHAPHRAADNAAMMNSKTCAMVAAIALSAASAAAQPVVTPVTLKAPDGV